MGTPETVQTMWRRSSRSGQNGNCVEIARITDTIAVRDSKAPATGQLVLSGPVWAAFINRPAIYAHRHSCLA